jgi:nitroimidazol reductase NimA-like FMN-containing flavoprotein (pyridoxamine 5'-phosphate oxidase superfamily)
MRRKDKQVSDPAIIGALFSAGKVCRIAMVDNGEPYVVPVNYGYLDNTLFIHSAAAGRKLDILKRHSRVCFEIESPVEIIEHAEPCHWDARARSLVGYAVASIVTDLPGKRHGLDVIMRHYGKRDANAYDQKQLEAVVILKVAIESVTCKQVGEWE